MVHKGNRPCQISQIYKQSNWVYLGPITMQSSN